MLTCDLFRPGLLDWVGFLKYQHHLCVTCGLLDETRHKKKEKKRRWQRLASEVSDRGAAACAEIQRLGHTTLKVWPAVGAGFTHQDRNWTFKELMKSWWLREHKYTSITIIWAGNDLTGWDAADPDALKQAVGDVVDWCKYWGVSLRLFDVVGRTYITAWRPGVEFYQAYFTRKGACYAQACTWIINMYMYLY